MLILAWIVSFICLIFLKKISSFSYFLVYLSCSLRKTFFSFLTILRTFPFSWVYIFLSSLPLVFFFSQLFVKPSQTIILISWISFSLGWFWSVPLVQCYEPPSIVLKALCLSDVITWIFLSIFFNAQSWKFWFRSYLNDPLIFPTFYRFSMNFAIRAHDLSHSQLLTRECLCIFSCWEYTNSDFSIHPLVMSMCKVIFCVFQFSSVHFSHLVMSDSLRPHELQHTRPACPSPTPRVHSSSCPSSW